MPQTVDIGQPRPDATDDHSPDRRKPTSRAGSSGRNAQSDTFFVPRRWIAPGFGLRCVVIGPASGCALVELRRSGRRERGARSDPSAVRARSITRHCSLVLTGCSSEEILRFGWPEGITPQAERMRELWTWSVVAALVMGILVWALTFWVIIATGVGRTIRSSRVRRHTTCRSSWLTPRRRSSPCVSSSTSRSWCRTTSWKRKTTRTSWST